MNINKTISIPIEINDLLSEEDNSSALISRLLREYYKTSQFEIKDIREHINTLEEKKKMQIEIIEKEKEKFIGVLKREEDEKLELEERQKLKEKKEQEKKDTIKLNYKDLTNKEMSDEKLEIYLSLLNNNEVGSLFDFIENEQTL